MAKNRVHDVVVYNLIVEVTVHKICESLRLAEPLSEVPINWVILINFTRFLHVLLFHPVVFKPPGVFGLSIYGNERSNQEWFEFVKEQPPDILNFRVVFHLEGIRVDVDLVVIANHLILADVQQV